MKKKTTTERLISERNVWHRKPATQVQPNKKAEQRRSFCRNRGKDEGAFPLFHTV